METTTTSTTTDRVDIDPDHGALMADLVAAGQRSDTPFGLYVIPSADFTIDVSELALSDYQLWIEAGRSFELFDGEFLVACIQVRFAQFRPRAVTSAGALSVYSGRSAAAVASAAYARAKLESAAMA